VHVDTLFVSEKCVQILQKKRTKQIRERFVFTTMNDNGHQASDHVLYNTYYDWLKNNTVLKDIEKDVNYFCQREKNASIFNSQITFFDDMNL
jgi:hypothetical protein